MARGQEAGLCHVTWDVMAVVTFHTVFSEHHALSRGTTLDKFLLHHTQSPGMKGQEASVRRTDGDGDVRCTWRARTFSPTRDWLLNVKT